MSGRVPLSELLKISHSIRLSARVLRLPLMRLPDKYNFWILDGKVTMEPLKALELKSRYVSAQG